MSRYIDVNMLIKKYIDTDIEKFSKSDVKIVLVNLKQNILKAPSIDIVRCKDCKWSAPNREGDYDCKCHIPTFRIKTDDFCSYGVRKTNTTAEEKPTPIRDYMVHGERRTDG